MRVLLAALPAVVVLTAACGGSGSPSAPTEATLAGTWQATRAEYVSRSNGAARVDLVAKGGSMVLTLASGTFTLVITDPGAGAQGTTLSGSWSASKEVLKMSPSGVSWSWEFDMTLAGNTLTLNNGGALYDVTGDGIMDEATLNLTMVRR